MHPSPSPSSLSPGALLAWATVLSSCLLPGTIAQSTAPGIVVGVSTGINNVTGQRPSRMNINDIYDEAGPHWDLYVQAMETFQRDDMTEIESYYQIAGIHGLPFLPWNGVNQTTGGANSGYCPHGQTTFITWHRPYLALFEQILARHVRKAAKQYPVETVDAYTAAAQTFRIPYWDWATDASLPPAVMSPTVRFNGPSGPSTMRNPLYSFQFPNYPFRGGGGGFGGSLAQFNETKRCTTTSGAAVGFSDEDRASSLMEGDGGQLQDKVYAVFTKSKTFEAMATMSNAGASFEEPHNVVHNDIACFSVAGHSGHMGDLNWSGFDPIFMLHHANVDRLFAMWQAINYNDPVFTTSQHGNALYGTPSGPMTADSPLKPFMAPPPVGGGAPVFYTSRSVETMGLFGYTYPEIDDWSLAPADLANTVRIAVNNLYGPDATTATASTAAKKMKAKRETKEETEQQQPSDLPGRHGWRLPRIRRARAAKRALSVGTVTSAVGSTVDTVGSTVASAADTVDSPVDSTVKSGTAALTYTPNARALDTNDYSIEVGVDRAQLPLPCTIELHLRTGDASGSATAYTRPVRIGSTSILSMPQTGTSYSTMPLRRVLVSEARRRNGAAVFNSNDDVLAALRAGVSVSITTPDGRSVPVSTVPSLSVTVQQRSYTPVNADNQFPQYGPVLSVSLKPLDLVL